ncbi:MAG: hypothetical protein LAT50_09220 [Ectothiorhodospiraceae bacterium]|nr:hypothetical protein [Ectothiorhodospiraceae bacterium]
MQIKSFDDLKTAGLAQPTPQRLLLVLLRAEAEADDDAGLGSGNDVVRGSGTLTPVMATDIELTPDTRLDVIAEEADSLGHPWDLVLVSSLSSRSGGLATSEEAAPYLQQMAEAVIQGEDLSRYAVFDRAGSPVRLAVTGAASDG